MAEVNFKFKLGDHLKDELTGFEGKVYARTEWYNGCLRYLLWGLKLNKETEKVTELSFDEEQLHLVEEQKRDPVKPERTGGPFDSVGRSDIYR